jgi:Flp pilus assembly pilin Flp
MNVRMLESRIRMSAIWRDDQAQDLIEYALIAGFVAVVAGAIMPGATSSLFSKLASMMGSGTSQGSAM